MDHLVTLTEVIEEPDNVSIKIGKISRRKDYDSLVFIDIKNEIDTIIKK